MKMTMIEQQFDGRYRCCRIPPRSEYKLRNIKNPAIFCVDCVFATDSEAAGTHCDEFIFFAINAQITGMYLIERKESASRDFKKVKEQLQGGAKFITNFVENDSAFDTYSHKFKPVLVSRGIQASRRTALSKNKIRLLGKKERIVHVQTNKALPPIT